MPSVQQIFIEPPTWVRFSSRDTWETCPVLKKLPVYCDDCCLSLVFSYHLVINVWNAMLQDSKFSRIGCCEILIVPAA